MSYWINRKIHHHTFPDKFMPYSTPRIDESVAIFSILCHVLAGMLENAVVGIALNCRIETTSEDFRESEITDKERGGKNEGGEGNSVASLAFI